MKVHKNIHGVFIEHFYKNRLIAPQELTTAFLNVKFVIPIPKNTPGFILNANGSSSFFRKNRLTDPQDVIVANFYDHYSNQNARKSP